MIRLLHLITIISYWHTVIASTGTLAKEFCRRDWLDSEVDTRAIITAVLPIREPILIGQKEQQRKESSRKDPFNSERKRKANEANLAQEPIDQKRKACGTVTQQGAQLLLAVDWVINILNVNTENVFGIDVNDSFIPGVKLGFRAYDTCGLDKVPVSQLIEAYAHFYAATKNCLTNSTTVNVGAIVGEMQPDDLLDSANYMRRYSQPFITQAAIPEVLADKMQYGNVFSTLPSIVSKAQAMIKLANQLGYTRVSLVFEDTNYGFEGKEQLVKSGKDTGLCITNVYKIPTVSNGGAGLSTFRPQIEASVKQLIGSLSHSSAIFVFASESTAVEFLQAAMNLSSANGLPQSHWILSDFIRESSRFAGMHPGRGLFALAPDSPSDVPEFREYWRNTIVEGLNNNWLKDYYQQTLGCRIPDEINPNMMSLPACRDGTTFALAEADPDIVINPYVISMIDNVYAFAKAMKKAWEIKCRGRPGICTQLMQMTREEYLEIVRNVEFKYDATMRSPPSLIGRSLSLRSSSLPPIAIFELVEKDGQLLFMEVYMYQNDLLQQTGQPIFYYADGSVGSEPPPSTCNGKSDPACTCPSSNTHVYEKVQPVYKAGDVVLVGVFPIHSNSEEYGASCGPVLARDGYQLAEGFWYALDKVNDKRSPAFSSILRGIRLGSLALDSCNSPPRVSHLASNLVIGGKIGFEAVDLHNQDIVGVIGDLGDQTSGELASILRFAGLPQLSYGGKSAILGDTFEYPGLLRTIVSDTTRLNMTFSALHQLGWDYVQVVASDSYYGRGMAKVFHSMAAEAGICIAQTVSISLNLSNAANVVEALLRKPNANAVILFLEKRPLRTILERLEQFYTSSPRRFVLIAPDYWYNDQDLLKGVELAAEGSLVFAARKLPNQHFQKYINSRSLTASANNPWLIEYLESGHRCSFPNSVNRHYSNVCNSSVNLGQIPGFRADLAVNDVINAVYAFVFGLDAMLKDYCGKNYQGLCDNFKSLPHRNELLFEYVREVTFEDETGRVFAFSEHRDAATPVVVLHVKKNSDGTGLHYAQAGLYSASDSEKSSFIEAVTVRALRSRTTSVCTLNGQFYCAECRRLTMKNTISNNDDSSSSTVPSEPRARNDRNSVATHLAKKEYYTKQFVYLHSNDKILVGAVLPVRERMSPFSPFQCGQLTTEGVFMVEALLWAVDAVNANSDVVRFQSGAVVFDSCTNAGQAFDSLKDLYTKPPGYFVTNDTEPLDADDIVAFINDPTDDSTASLASELLSSLNVTNFAVGSITSEQQNNQSYLLHTISPMLVQIGALFSFLEHNNWTYVSIVYSGRRWGSQAYFRFKSEALDRGICFAVELAIHADDSDLQMDNVTSILKSKISNDESGGARVVILLLDIKETSAFLRGVGRSMNDNAANPLIFIGTASWGDHIPFSEGEEQVALGSIIFQHDSQPVDVFRTYVESLRYDNNDRNPWWREFWRTKFHCESDEECSKHALSENDFRNEAIYTNVMNAVWASSVSLNNLCTSGFKRRQQQQQTSPCRGIQKSKNFRSRLLENIRNAAFARVDNGQESFRFTKNGWSDSGFFLLNLVQDESGNLEYKAVGHYTEKDGLTFSEPMYRYDSNNARVPLNELKSSCSDLKLCLQCANRLAKMQHNFAGGSLSELALVTANPQIAGSFLMANGTSTAYGVHLSNATYTDSFLYAPGSANGYLIAVTFPVHERGPRPLTCGHLRPEHYQNLQAFLWAMKILHSDETLLGGAKLGALVFDTCSDSTKAVRDLSNFLSEQVIFRTAKGERIEPARTIAVLNSPYTKEALPIAEVSYDYGIPNVSPGMSASMVTLADTYKIGMTVRTSVPTDVQARAVAAFLTRIGWNAVSFLHTDNVFGANGKMDFHAEANHRDICIVLSEILPESDNSNCTEVAPKVDQTLARLLAAKKAGVHGVVVWLTENGLRCLFAGVKRAVTRGTLKLGELNFVLAAEVADLHSTIIDEFERESIGFVALQYTAANVDQFSDYWKTLPASDDVAGHFWSKEFQQRPDHLNSAYRQNAYLLNTINAAFSVAVGLEQLRRNVCKGGQDAGGSLCQAMTKNPQFRSLLLDSIRKVEFDDVSGKRFQFLRGSFGNEALTILNLVKKDKSSELRQIGQYESDNLKLRMPPQGFDSPSHSMFNLRDRPSRCGTKESRICAMCSSGRKSSTFGADFSDLTSTPTDGFGLNTNVIMASTTDPWSSLIEQQQNQSTDTSSLVAESPLRPASFPTGLTTQIVIGSSRLAKDMVILPPSRRFTIAGIFSVHKLGPTPLTCGGLNSMTGFQQLAAFLFAVNEINLDPNLLPGIELGAVAIDDCSSEERSLADMFEFLSTPDSTIGPPDLVAAIGNNFGSGEMNMGKFFHNLNVPIISAGPTPMAWREDTMLLGTVPSDETYAMIVADIFRQMKWSYFSTLYESSPAYEATAKHFEKSLTINRLGCLARSISLSSDAPLEETQAAVRQLVLAAGSKAVALFLSDRNALQLLKAVVAENVPNGRFIFVTKFNEEWILDADFLVPLQRFGQGLLTVEFHRRNLSNFANYISSLTLQNYAPFPKAWFEDFWQHTFQCVLPNGISINQQFSSPCTGEERLTVGNFAQGATVLPTILAVHSVAHGLHRFLAQNCPSNTAESVDACLAESHHNLQLSNPKVELIKSIRATNFTYVYESLKEPVSVSFGRRNFLDTEYTIRNFMRNSDDNFRAQEVGVWRPVTGLVLDNAQVLMPDSGGKKLVPSSTCLGETCTAQCAAAYSSTTAASNSSIFASDSKAPPGQVASASLYFHSIWGIVVAVVAALGILTCAVCIVYFMVTFPVSHGTTVLGYMILFGLIVLYALAFAYVVAPTAFSCSVRRLFTGICWAFVFAPMLMKVLYAWHVRSIGKAKPPVRPENRNSPCTLFIISLGIAFVQIAIAIEWIILQTPNGVVYVTNFRGEPVSSSSTGVWRCSPGDQFEMMIVISTVYVMFLLFLTTLLSLLTWNTDEQNRESRWIFLACIASIAIWLTWTFSATKLEYKIRDPAIAISIVVNATIILLCLYLRKAYLYNKYRREAKEVMFETHSAVYLTSTLASGGQLMLERANGYYDDKNDIIPVNGNHYSGVHTSMTNTEIITTNPRRSVSSATTGMVMNGRRSTTREEGRTSFYTNSLFDGNGICEFNPGARGQSASNGLGLFNGKTNGSLRRSSPVHHRF